VRELIAAVLAAVGIGFSLSGAVGIIRMPDLYTRIQCSSKTVTMGALPTLAALLVAKGPYSTYGSRVLLVAFLLLIVNPMASQALARAAYKSGIGLWPGSVLEQGGGRPDDHQREP
jgi:multicomponent Na+:H+ antiporter subunit G